jgi:hypothetical protein
LTDLGILMFVALVKLIAVGLKLIKNLNANKKETAVIETLIYLMGIKNLISLIQNYHCFLIIQIIATPLEIWFRNIISHSWKRICN